MTLDKFKKLETGDYSAICPYEGECTIHINRIPNGMGGYCQAAGCSIESCCRDCYASSGYELYFDIKQK